MTRFLRQHLDTSRGWTVLLFLLALAPRLPGLRLFLTTDEPFFVQEAAEVSSALLRGDFQGTYWHFYPGVTISWLDGLGLGAQWAIARLIGATIQPFGAYIHSDILDLMVAVRLPYALLTAVGVAGFYLLTRRLLSHRAALLSALFIASDPFFLAHSRVAHGDAPVTVFMGLSALAFFVYLRTSSIQYSTPNTQHAIHSALHAPHSTLHASRSTLHASRSGGDRRWLILSAVMAALAALTKAPGQFMVPFVIIIGVGDWLIGSWRVRRPDWRLAGRWLVDLALWGSVVAFLFVALWPAMWGDPLGTLVRMLDETFGKVEEGHLVYFMGQPTLNPGPWFYLYVIPFRLTPVTLIGVLASGVVILGGWVRLARKRKGSAPCRDGASQLRAGTVRVNKDFLPDRYVSAALLWFFVVTLLLVGNLSPKKQDRYLLPLFPFLDLLAAFALVEISKWASEQMSKWASGQMGESANQRVSNPAPCRDGANQQDNKMWLLRRFAVLILLVVHSLPTLTTYPYYLAYFNPLMGGLPRAVETTLIGWGEGMEQAAYYLDRKPDSELLYVAAVPAQTFLPYFRGRGENFYTNDIALRADYVVLYVSQVQRLAPSPEIVRHFRAMEPEHTVYVRGVPYAWIYPGPKLITTDVPADATLTNVGFGHQLRLAGYQISNLKSQISNLEIVLYWHALAPMSADYTISVRLVAPDGAWLAQHDGWPARGLLPTSQWRRGDYVQDAHTLEVPSGTAVEWVQVVVYDAASGQPLGAPVDLPAIGGHELGE